jgi:AcrR family transcriptional regulator
MDSAVEVFERDGYMNATVDAIVDVASATRATFYQYFRSKREVIEALADEMGKQGTLQVQAAYHAVENEADSSARASLRTWFEEVSLFWETKRAVLEALDDAEASDRELRERRDSAYQKNVDLLAAYLESAGCRYPPKPYALLLAAQHEQFLRLSIIRRWPVDREQALSVLVEIWSDAFAGRRRPT